MVKQLYPTCYKSFNKWISSNKNYQNVYELVKPRIFDVSLRDGLQSIKKEEQEKYSTKIKTELYNNILNKYRPDFIEIGSLVSEKVLPVFSDSIQMYQNTISNRDKNFILVPSFSRFKPIIDNKITNISLITSVSESFQMANIKKSLSKTKFEILEIMYELYSNKSIINPKVKLYMSCIDHCPIEGKIPNKLIVDEIRYYNEICKPDIICLSDTCANLTHDNFSKIIEQINLNGVPNEKISLHLHVSPDNPEQIVQAQKIFSYSLDKKILEFDISLLETGGCSVTMGSSKTKPNLSYELYYKFLVDYILDKQK